MCRNSDIGVFRARGFSLVELMVAVVIGLLVLAAVTTILVNSKKNYTVQDSLARLQENARFAVDSITRGMRMSGHFGCAHEPLKATQNQLAVGGTLYNATTGLAGVEDIAVGTSKWYPSAENTADPSGTIKYVPGSDVLLVRYMNGAGAALAVSMTAPTDPLIVTPNSNAPLNNGDIAIDADCDTADLFQITAVTSNNDGTLTVAHATGANKKDSFGDLDQPKNYELDQRPIITGFTIVRYFVATNTDRPGRPGLYRQIGAAAPQELVEGIESMQILYGVNTSQPPPAN